MHEFAVVDVVRKNRMGSYTYITVNQWQEVGYRHPYPHLVSLGANLRFGMAKIEDHRYGYQENDKGDGSGNQNDHSPQDSPPRWPSGTLSISPLPKPIEPDPAHDPDPDGR